jgi:hypothetical protein
MDWRHGSRGRVPALQIQNPESKPQSQPKKKKKIYWAEKAVIRNGKMRHRNYNHS